MSLLKILGNMARKSNARAFDRIEEHERKVSDGKCCHCSNFSYPYCIKHGLEMTDDESKRLECGDFSPKSISPFDL